MIDTIEQLPIANTRRSRVKIVPLTPEQKLLVETNYPLALKMATRMARAQPRSHIHDLVSDAAIGLIRAAQLFDNRPGVPFVAMAVQRIRGAMMDGIRRRRFIPRNSAARGEREPKFVSTAAILEDDPFFGPSDVDLRDFRDSGRDHVENEEMVRYLASKVYGWQREVLILRFIHGLTIRQTAAQLRVCDSYVSLLTSRAVEKIKKSELG